MKMTENIPIHLIAPRSVQALSDWDYFYRKVFSSRKPYLDKRQILLDNNTMSSN